MGKTITVSSYLLEDIFRLLDYLNIQCGYDNRHFHKSGYSIRMEQDNALWELKFKIKRLQNQVLDTYLLTIGDITESEMEDLHEWVAAGRSVYDNPCFIYDESGRPMDFINGCRAAFEIDEDENPSSFVFGDPDAVDGRGLDDDLPF
jgi:hypothetical protein